MPREPFLAAAIDGAGPIRTFLRVTFPMMAPISIGAIMIRLIEASKIMDTVYVITSGGPGTATETSAITSSSAACAISDRLRRVAVPHLPGHHVAPLTIIAKVLARACSSEGDGMQAVPRPQVRRDPVWSAFVLAPFLWALTTSFQDRQRRHRGPDLHPVAAIRTLARGLESLFGGGGGGIQIARPYIAA